MEFYIGRREKDDGDYKITYVGSDEDRAVESYRAETWMRGQHNLILLVEVPMDISVKTKIIYNPLKSS